MYRIICDGNSCNSFVFTDRQSAFYKGSVVGFKDDGFFIWGKRVLNRVVPLSGDVPIGELIEVYPYMVVFQGKGGSAALTMIEYSRAMGISVNGSEKVGVGLLFDNVINDIRHIAGNRIVVVNGSDYLVIVCDSDIDISLDKNMVVVHSSKNSKARFVIGYGEDIADSIFNSFDNKESGYKKWCSGFDFRSGVEDLDRAIYFGTAAIRELTIKTDRGMGIWAGLPWFLNNWGRDTFISLPGILVLSRFDEARNIILGFAEYQDKDPSSKTYGRIPNIVDRGSIAYNTADGTPLFVRAVYEYINYSDDRDIISRILPTIITAYNGSKMRLDDNGFLLHGEADTWMDARINGKEAYSPRGNRAIEVEVLYANQLYITAKLLEINGQLKEADKIRKEADTLKDKINMLFWNDEMGMFYDRIDKNGTKDKKIRPNQVLATMWDMFDVVDNKQAALITKNVITKLLYRHGVASLWQGDEFFHPYHHYDMWHFDSAYHNGTVWVWNSGAFIELLLRMGYKELAFEHTIALIEQMFNMGVCGHLSELVEAIPRDETIRLSGTYSQAWSMSEFNRVLFQGYLGIRPFLLNGYIKIEPNIPPSMGDIDTKISIGKGIIIYYRHTASINKTTISFAGLYNDIRCLFVFNIDGARYSFEFDIQQDIDYSLWYNDNNFFLNAKRIEVKLLSPSYKPLIGNISFLKPDIPKGLKTISTMDYLKNLILSGKYST